MMRILNLANVDSEGAGIAVSRTHKRLMSLGYDSHLLLDKDIHPQNRLSKKFNHYLDKVKYILSKYKLNRIKYDPKYSFYTTQEKNHININLLLSQIQDGDIIIIYWIAGGYLNTSNLSAIKKNFDVQIFWYAVDMAPFTGGCHYYWTCNGHKFDCQKCPAILNGSKKIASAQLALKKQNILNTEITILASSDTGVVKMQESSIKYFDYKKLPYAIDVEVFIPRPKKREKNVLKVFFNAQNAHVIRKGFSYLVDVINKLKPLLLETNFEIHLLSVNAEEHHKFISENDNIKIIPLKRPANAERELAKLYNMSDLMICTSVEDLSPLMVNEALLCGVPVIGFKNASNSEYIQDGKNGFLVAEHDTMRIADLVVRILRHEIIFDVPEVIRQSVYNIHESNSWNKIFKEVIKK